MNKLKVLSFQGSLREKSFNKYLLENLKDISEDIIDLNIFDIADIPLYNEDLWNNPPSSVLNFKKDVDRYNSIIISTPEYNYSYSGVLKNSIDWLSRNPNILNRKVVGIMGASTGAIGTARAQLLLRSTLATLNTYVMPKPEIFLSFAESKFSQDGKLTDKDSIDRIRIYSEEFVKFSSDFYK
jgi:chromate reductase